jgi:chromosome segregation ATPase
MDVFGKSNSVLWETGNYLAQLEKENEIIERQVKELLGQGINEEETIKEYDLPFTKPKPDKNNEIDRESLYQQQVSYLESRLESYAEHIKQLESTIKDKDNYIIQLEKRIQRPQSPIREIMRDPPTVHTTFATNLKRREKELEKKIQETEKKMTEERKTMQRLQNLNRNLLMKFKEAQEREPEFKARIDKTIVKEARANNLVEENHQLNIICHELHERVESLQSELSKMQVNYNTLLSTSIDFEEKSQELYHLNQMLNQKLQSFIKST